MAIKTVLSDLGEAPESLRDEYKEQKVGDKTIYVLDLDGIDDHPKVRGVITANSANKAKRDEYKTKLDAAEARLVGLPEDFDADEWTRLKAGDGGNKDEAIQALKDQNARAIETLKTKHANDLADRDRQIGERDGYIDRTMRNDDLRKALRDAGVDMDQHEDVLLDYLGKQVKVQRADNGDRKTIVETDMGDISVTDFVKEWANGKGKAYLAKPGGPEPKGNNGDGRGDHSQKGSFGGNRDERVNAIANKFPDLPRQ